MASVGAETMSAGSDLDFGPQLNGMIPALVPVGCDSFMTMNVLCNRFHVQSC